METSKHKIEILKGDITKVHVDAIVNAANSSLMGGGGVDGAIHRAGGKTILDECKTIIKKIGSCKTGEGGQNNEEALLANCYINSLQKAIDNNCKTVAFPNISTGVYHFPKEKAASISFKTVIQFLSDSDKIEKVFFVCFDEENYRLLKLMIS